MPKRASLLLCLFCVLLGVFFAQLPSTIAQIRSTISDGSGNGKVDWAAAFAEVRRLILDKHVDKPSDEVLLKGAIKGMTDALNDPYTEFVPPADKAAFEKDLTGQFVGIGATVNVREGWLTIVYPLEDSPAYGAGLIPDDKVTAVNGKSTKGLSVEECVKQLLGEPDTLVTLEIERQAGEAEGKPKTFEVKLNRAAISATSVKGFRWDGAMNGAKGGWEHLMDSAAAPNGIVYVRLTQFTPGVAREFLRAVQKGGTRGGMPSGLILDLRDNPGGLLEEALTIVDMFVDSGVMLSTKGRAGTDATFKANRGGPLVNMPTVVLVNQSSASASEIVAGALQDLNKAVVVGTRSFGKGLVQRIEPLMRVEGAELKLTEQHYYLPSGRMIQRTDEAKTWGVDPSPGFYVPLSDDESTDVFLTRREMEVVRPAGAPRAVERVIPGIKARPDLWGPDAKWGSAAWLENGLRERQLAAAMGAVQGRVASGEWKATGVELAADQMRGIAMTELTRLGRVRQRLETELDRVDKRMVAIEDGRPEATKAPEDLWDNGIDLTGGRVDVYDKDGKVIATLDVTGNDVERWLMDADLKVRKKADGGTIIGNPGDVTRDGKPGLEPVKKPEGK